MPKAMRRRLPIEWLPASLRPPRAVWPLRGTTGGARWLATAPSPSLSPSFAPSQGSVLRLSLQQRAPMLLLRSRALSLPLLFPQPVSPRAPPSGGPATSPLLRKRPPEQERARKGGPQCANQLRLDPVSQREVSRPFIPIATLNACRIYYVREMLASPALCSKNQTNGTARCPVHGSSAGGTHLSTPFLHGAGDLTREKVGTRVQRTE